MVSLTKPPSSLQDGTIYSSRKDFRPFSTPSLEAYASIVSEEKLDRLERVAQRLKGLKLLEINATAQGGGVAELLYSAIPFLNMLGIEAEWKILRGNKDYFECTKSMHNFLQGMKGNFTPEMEQTYNQTLLACANDGLIDYSPDVVVAHDPQPLGLCHYLKKPGQSWLWRCHIDIEEAAMDTNPALWNAITSWTEQYDATIFSAAHYVISRWPLPKFIVPPFIDPLSEKNRELSQKEIDKVLRKYHIDSRVPIVAQIGRFDPWKGLDRTIDTYRLVRQKVKCQLIIAGGFASDDPEGERVLADLYDKTKDDEDIHILNLHLEDRLDNYLEVNALQRAARVIMQPSTREGFGLVITEALWKGKPVIGANVGAIPLQIRDDDTGYFYSTPPETARKVIHFLEHPADADAMGRKAKKYVADHFLLPDRIADHLTVIDMVLNRTGDNKLPDDSIISFHPWFKLSKR